MNIQNLLFEQREMSANKGRRLALTKFGTTLIALAFLLLFLVQNAFAQPTVNLIWTTKAPLLTGRNALAIGVVNNRIYAIGGHQFGVPGSAGTLATAEEYDPATNTWTAKASMGTAREQLAVGVVNNKIYAVGGWNGVNTSFPTVEEYDPMMNTWTPKASMPTSRIGLAIGVVNNKLYAVGGTDGFGSFFTAVEEYDPATDAWTTKAPMPTGRAYLAIGVVNNKIYAIGGRDVSGSQLTTVEEYDPATNTWMPKAPMPTSREQLAIGVVNNKLYAIGGDPGQLTTVEEYDPVTNTWTNCGIPTPGNNCTPMLTGRAFLAVGVVNNKLYAVGGNAGAFDTVEEGIPLPVDVTPPVVNVSFPSPNGQNGWFVTSPVIGSVTANDTTTGGSNITAINCTGATVGSITGLGTPSASAPLTVSAESVNTVSCTATDSAGNSGAGAGSNNTAIVQIDTIAPAVLITSPADGGSYLLNAAVAADYTCTDATSAVATCDGPVPSGSDIDTGSVGAKIFTVNATDNAGHTASLDHTYNVIYNFNGFFPPIDNLPTLNKVKAGSAVPIKFSLSGDQGLNIFEADYPKSQVISCDTSAPLSDIDETVTAGSSSLCYDASADQCVYVWKTDKSWAGTCRQLIVKLIDGTSHLANFKFK